MKNIKNEITSFGLSFLRDPKREEQKKEEKKEEKKKRKKKEEKSKSMDFYGFLWIILDTFIYFYGFVWKKKKSNHKPIFDEFGSKRTLFGI